MIQIMKKRTLTNRFISKGDKNKWTLLNEVKKVTLTKDLMKGKILSKNELEKRRLANLNDNFLIP